MAGIVANRIVKDDRLFAFPPMETIFENFQWQGNGIDIIDVSDKPRQVNR